MKMIISEGREQKVKRFILLKNLHLNMYIYRHSKIGYSFKKVINTGTPNTQVLRESDCQQFTKKVNKQALSN